MRNRADAVDIHPAGRGVQCRWRYSTTLHLVDVFPVAGRWLLRRALLDVPIELKEKPTHVGDDLVCANQSTSVGPQISFLIGHRGRERLPHLLKTLHSIGAQRDVSFECIVVEQSTQPEIRDELPGWVRYQHTPCPANLPYVRSWSLNVAAAQARAPVLVFHDNDLLVPAVYGVSVKDCADEGYEIINLKRFIFYLTKHDQFASSFAGTDVESVVQNAEAGGSLAIKREVFEAIGGYDESFVGWGGEDIECWDRCATRRVWRYACLPMLHLWHPPQPGKRAVRGLGEATANLTEARMAIDPQARIDELRQRPRGRLNWTGDTPA